jgi:hypothetical protein
MFVNAIRTVRIARSETPGRPKFLGSLPRGLEIRAYKTVLNKADNKYTTAPPKSPAQDGLHPHRQK